MKSLLKLGMFILTGVIFTLTANAKETSPPHSFELISVIPGQSFIFDTKEYKIDIIDDIPPDAGDTCTSHKRELALYHKDDNTGKASFRFPIGRDNNVWDVGPHAWYDPRVDKVWILGLDFPKADKCDQVVPVIYVLEPATRTLKKITASDTYNFPVLPVNVVSDEKGTARFVVNVLGDKHTTGLNHLCTIDETTEKYSCVLIQDSATTGNVIAATNTLPATKLKALKQRYLVARENLKTSAADPENKVHLMPSAYSKDQRYTPLGIRLLSLYQQSGIDGALGTEKDGTFFDGVDLDYDEKSGLYIMAAMSGMTPYLLGIRLDSQGASYAWKINLKEQDGFDYVYSIEVAEGQVAVYEYYNNAAHRGIFNIENGAVFVAGFHDDINTFMLLPPYVAGKFTNENNQLTFYQSWFNSHGNSQNMTSRGPMMTFSYPQILYSTDRTLMSPMSKEIQLTSATGIDGQSSIMAYMQSLNGVNPTGDMQDQIVAIGQDGTIQASYPLPHTQNMLFCRSFNYYITHTAAGIRNNVTEVYTSYAVTDSCSKDSCDCTTENYVVKYRFH